MFKCTSIIVSCMIRLCTYANMKPRSNLGSVYDISSHVKDDAVISQLTWVHSIFDHTQGSDEKNTRSLGPFNMNQIYKRTQNALVYNICHVISQNNINRVPLILWSHCYEYIILKDFYITNHAAFLCSTRTNNFFQRDSISLYVPIAL